MAVGLGLLTNINMFTGWLK